MRPKHGPRSGARYKALRCRAARSHSGNLSMVSVHDDPEVTGSNQADRRRLVVALALIVAFMLGEIAAGVLAHSLALVSDSAHMLTDAGAIALSLVALQLARRPPSGGLTYGLKRTEILAALANGTALGVLALLLLAEGIRRLISPAQANGWVMLGVALAGIAVNVVATWQLAGANRQSLNIRASFKHVLVDLWAFIGTALAAVVIIASGFERADPIASLFVVALMIRTGYGLVTGTGRVLLEAAPEGISTSDIESAMYANGCVTDVHDLHVWEITSGFPALSAHVLVHPGHDCHGVRRDIERILSERFDIDHTTLQVDHDERDGPVVIGARPGPTEHHH